MATVPDVLAALVAVETHISDIKAYQYPPDTLERANLPCCINLPGAARHSRVADGYLVSVRDYLILVAIAPTSGDKTPRLLELGAQYIDLFTKLFQEHVKLGGSVPTVQQAILTNDSGVVKFDYENDTQKYIGFELTVSVTVKEAVVVGL